MTSEIIVVVKKGHSMPINALLYIPYSRKKKNIIKKND